MLLEIRQTNSQTKNNYILDVKKKWGFFLIKNNINVNGKNNKLEDVIEFNFKKLKKEVSDYLYNSNDDYK